MEEQGEEKACILNEAVVEVEQRPPSISMEGWFEIDAGDGGRLMGGMEGD